MLQLIDEVFATRNDPDQIQVTQKQLKKLGAIHSATLSEYANQEGPLIWILMIPTTTVIMTEFLSGKISEKGLLKKTKPGISYDCIYLCSATTLAEYRGKGKTKQVCLEAIERIMKDHPIKTLFVWPFSAEGRRLADSLANACGLKLLEKTSH